MSPGESIRSLRREGGYTQKQLAGIIGVKATYISALERDQRRPGRKIIPLLCDALGVDEMTLLYGPRKVCPDLEAHDYVPSEAIARLSKQQLAAVLEFVKQRITSGFLFDNPLD